MEACLALPIPSQIEPMDASPDKIGLSAPYPSKEVDKRPAWARFQAAPKKRAWAQFQVKDKHPEPAEASRTTCAPESPQATLTTESHSPGLEQVHTPDAQEVGASPEPVVEDERQKASTRGTSRAKRAANAKCKHASAPTETDTPAEAQVEGAVADIGAGPGDIGEDRGGYAPPPTTPRKSECDAGPSSKRRKFVFQAGDPFEHVRVDTGAEEVPTAVVFEATGSAAMVSVEMATPDTKQTARSKLESSSETVHPGKLTRAGSNKGSRSVHTHSWARVELERALAGVAKETDSGPRIVRKRDLEAWLESPASVCIRDLGLATGCRRTAAQFTDEQAPLLQYFLDRAVFEADLPHAPMSGIRDAEPDEIAELPKIAAEFAFYLSELQGVNNTTRNCYLSHFFHAFKFDGKAPEEMGSLTYQHAVKHTWEDVVANHIMGSCVIKFADFWQQYGSRPFTRDTGAPRVKQTPPQPKSATRRQPEEGDGSEAARAADGLPEGWHVHRSKNRTLAWTTPQGHWLMSRAQVMRRLNPVPAPALEFLPPPPPSSSAVSVLTPEKKPRPEKGEFAPLAVLLQPLPKAGDPHAAGDRDRQLLPCVVATFARLGEGKGEVCQVIRDAHALYFFRMFAESQRSFEAIADPSFVVLLAQSEENKKCHGILVSALSSFRTFWLAHGGYESMFDEADGESLRLTLQVKPKTVEATGECGFGSTASGELCQRPKRKCETCSTVLCCGKHEEHTVEICKEVFWTKHSTDGMRIRTMADFFGKKAAKPTCGVAHG